MIAWSAASDPFTPPSGPLDLYQSLQRIEPGGWLAAHTHEGPECGVILAGTLARFEDGETRAFAAGEAFLTRAGSIHATGNPNDTVGEAITLHVVSAGSAFSTPCECIGAPAAAPGSVNPARSIFRNVSAIEAPHVAEHALVVLGATETIALEDHALLLVTALDADITVNGMPLSPLAFLHVFGPSDVTLVANEHTARVLVARLSPHAQA